MVEDKSCKPVYAEGNFGLFWRVNMQHRHVHRGRGFCPGPRGGLGFPHRVNIVSAVAAAVSDPHAGRPQVESLIFSLFTSTRPGSDVRRPAGMRVPFHQKPTHSGFQSCLSIITNRPKPQSESLHSFRRGGKVIAPTSSESYPPTPHKSFPICCIEITT